MCIYICLYVYIYMYIYVYIYVQYPRNNHQPTLVDCSHCSTGFMGYNSSWDYNCWWYISSQTFIYIFRILSTPGWLKSRLKGGYRVQCPAMHQAPKGVAGQFSSAETSGTTRAAWREIIRWVTFEKIKHGKWQFRRKCGMDGEHHLEMFCFSPLPYLVARG